VNNNLTRTVLVTGATGNVGRHLVPALLEAGVGVRALVRHPFTAGLPDAVDVVEGDLTAPDDVARAAEGADAAFLLWPGFDATGAAEIAGALADHVERIVYLSAAELQGDRAGPKDGVWADVEAAIRATGVGWSFLRAGGFAANALGWSPAIRAGQPVALPYPEAVRSPVHERDIADAAMACLLDPRHDGRAYEITGPEQLTLRRQAEILGESLGRPVAVHHQSAVESEAETSALLGPQYAAAALTYWATLEASPERVSDDVERITGHPPRAFAGWAHDHADDFRPLDTATVAHRYADAFRRGDIAAATAVLAPDVVRVAPLENGGQEIEVRGFAAIAENAATQNSDVDLEGVEVAAPMVGPDSFAIRFTFDERVRSTGAAQRTTKISMCRVEAGRIVREDVFFFTNPTAVAAAG